MNWLDSDGCDGDAGIDDDGRGVRVGSLECMSMKVERERESQSSMKKLTFFTIN